MSSRIPGMPGGAAHAAAVILSLIMTLCLLLSGCTALANTLMNNTALHESVALSDQVQAAQKAKIFAKVNTLAEKYSFDPETVNAFLTDEAIADYNRQVIAWWMSLLDTAPSLTAPSFSTTDMIEAVMADEQFKENTSTGRRKAIARDEVAAVIAQTVQETVLPLRSALISLGMSQVLQRINLAKYTAIVPHLPWIFLGISVMLMCLTVLVMARRPLRALAYIGGSLSAAGILDLALILCLKLLDLPGWVGQVSAMLSLQVSLLQERLMPLMLIGGGCALAIGLVLIGLHQHGMLKIRRSLAAKGVAV